MSRLTITGDQAYIKRMYSHLRKEHPSTRQRMKMNDKLYRGRGIYEGTGKESYITTVWRRSEQEVNDDIKMFGTRYKNPRIVEMDLIKHLNSNRARRQKNPYPRIG